MIVKITNKKQMYKLLKRGSFGNTVRHWDTLWQMCEDPYDGPVGMRVHTVGRPGKFYHNTKYELCHHIWENNIPEEEYELYESPPDDYRRIQGELCESYGGYYFRYTFAQGAMRLAFEEQERHALGLECIGLLRRYVEPSGISNLFALLDKYPGCVVEFTSYRIPVGYLRQTIIVWEVRHY